MHATETIWKSEDNLWEPVLSFYQMASGNEAWVISLDSKPLYPQMHLPASYYIYWLPHFLLCFT